MTAQLDLFTLAEWVILTSVSISLLSLIYRFVTRDRRYDQQLSFPMWRGEENLKLYSASTDEAESLLKRAEANASLGNSREAVELSHGAVENLLIQLLSKVLPSAGGVGMVDAARLIVMKGFPRGFMTSANLLNDLHLRTMLGERTTSEDAKRAVATAKAVIAASKDIPISPMEREG